MRDRYVEACRLVGVAKLSRKLPEVDAFDPGSLPAVHHAIAASFRFTQADSGQMLLGEDVAAYRTRC